MKRRWIMALACLGTLVGIILPMGAGQTASANGNRAELKALADELVKAAADWMADKPADSALENKIKAVTYDDDGARVMVSLLNEYAGKPDPVNLYVATKLLQPLTMAKTEVVRKAMPGAKEVCKRLIRYVDFPKLSKAEEDALKVPNDPKMSVDDVVKAKERVQKVQEQKIAKDRATKLHNEQAFRLEKMMYKLMILAGDEAFDKEVLEAIFKAEREGTRLFFDLLGMVRSEASKMDEKRAKVYYDTLAKMSKMPVDGREMRMRKAKYKDLGTPRLNPTGESGYEAKDDYPGIAILTTLNQVATSAKQPSLTVPSQADVDKSYGKTSGGTKKDDKKDTKK
jgi:hypothetical protein